MTVDTLYYLSVAKSRLTPVDSLNCFSASMTETVEVSFYVTFTQQASFTV